MRILALLVVVACAAMPLSAQRSPGGAPSIHPLPVELAPGDASSSSGRVAMDAMDRGMLTGVLVGMTTGVVFATTVADRCGVESDCTLSPEYKTLIYGIIGTTLGAAIGIGATFVQGWRAARPEDSYALDVAPQGGGMRVGVTLRH